MGGRQGNRDDFYMLALRRDESVFAMLPTTRTGRLGLSPPARPLIVGLRMEPSEIDEMLARLGPDESWGRNNQSLTDRYGITSG